ncbi:MAG: EAL domain-containing protein [Deltaproteobacteria bacterium]|nr:EAL domain-containing protein [Deltaproteobacteria bacterium]
MTERSNNPANHPLPGRIALSPEGEFLDINGLLAEITVLRQREAAYRGMFENAVEGFFQTTPDGAYLNVNPALARIYGYKSPAELMENIKDIERMLYVEPTRRSEFQRIMREEGRVQCFESAIYRKGGEVIWISENARRVTDRQGRILYYEGTVVDITDRKQAQEALERSESIFRSLAETAGAAIYIMQEGEIRYINPATLRLTGYQRRELIGMRAEDLVHEQDRERICGREEGGGGEESRERTEIFRLRTKDGAVRWVEDKFSSIDYQGQPAILGVAIDITDRKKAEAKLTHQAFHDPLTGLPNRALFLDRLQAALGRYRREPSRFFAVLFLDLDRFKLVNDSLGHQVGDQLLIEISRRLSGCLRSSDTVARFGGDEFVLLLEGLEEIREVNLVIERIQAELHLPFNLEGHEVFTSASIGVVLSQNGYEQAEDVVRDSDIAMYRAKNQGRSRYEVFDSRMHRQALKLLQMENDLRRALERREFVVVYQPIYCLQSHELCAVEALLRWEHPARGLVLPEDFIPLAEETGLIVPIGQWVMSEACRELKHWQSRRPELAELVVCVNLSARQLDQPDLVEQVRDVLQETELEPNCLKLEITESVLMNNASEAIDTLHRLKALGVMVAVDDFGTGYSSLSYLHRLPIDTLKVDRSFVSNMKDDQDNREIVRTVISLARTLGLDVVAEGVEESEQETELCNLECQYVQGFLYSQPLSSRELAERMNWHRPPDRGNDDPGSAA